MYLPQQPRDVGSDVAHVLGTLAVVLFWNGICAAFAWKLYMRPHRQRRLCRLGVATPGVIVEGGEPEGRNRGRTIHYAFTPADGRQRTGRTEVYPSNPPPPHVGQPVTVLYASGKEDRSIVYEYCDFVADTLPPCRAASAEELRFYQRVQQYDADGNFLRGWQLDTATKSFRLTVDEHGRLVAATPRGNNHIYSPDGGILESRPDDGAMHNDLADSARHGIVGADGATYRLESRFVSPRVVRVDRDGTTHTVVSQPWYNGLLMGPLPAWLFWMLGIVTLGGAEHLKKARRRSVPTAHVLQSDERNPRSVGRS